MKIGINRWTLPGHLTLNECFTLAAASGFDSVEINIAEDGELTAQTTEAEVSQIVKSAAEAGVELSSLSTGLGWKYPLTSADPGIRAEGINCIRKQLQAAAWMGVDTILVVPGVVNAEVAYDDAYERAQSALKELAADAERLGVYIGVENVWNKFLLSPLEFASFIDGVGSEYVGAYFDVGNVLVYGFPEQWIKILGPRIKKIHVKDFRSGIGNINGFCNPLQGDVAWYRVRAALAEIGYNSYITGEVDGYRTNPDLGLKHIAESLRSIFGEI